MDYDKPVTCKQCSISFNRGINTEGLYCSRKCYNEMRYARYTERMRQMKEEGIIHGRTIKEHKYYTYKSRAKAREISFELSIDQFLEMWQLPCRYCGSDIKTIGVDRVDNTRGYVLDNVVSCCTTCNLMKRGMNAQDFISHCKKIK